MTTKRFHYDRALEYIYDYDTCEDGIAENFGCFEACELLNELNDQNKELQKKNEQLKKGMIGVVDRYIKNVDCNPPSSARTYIKIKGALLNI